MPSIPNPALPLLMQADEQARYDRLAFAREDGHGWPTAEQIAADLAADAATERRARDARRTNFHD